MSASVTGVKVFVEYGWKYVAGFDGFCNNRWAVFENRRIGIYTCIASDIIECFDRAIIVD